MIRLPLLDENVLRINAEMENRIMSNPARTSNGSPLPAAAGRFTAHSNALPAIGLLMACAAVALFYNICVLSLDLWHSTLLNLDPRPDAVEYFAGAVNLVRHGLCCLNIGDQFLPLRYPCGFSYVQAGVMKLMGSQAQILAPFRTNQMLGLLMICGGAVYFAFRKQWGMGSVFVLYLATLPAFILLSRSSLSESLTMALYLLIAVCLFHANRHILFYYLAAVALALACYVRLSVVFMGPLLLWPLFYNRQTFFSRVRTTVFGGFVFALMLVPMMYQNMYWFGSPLRTGYDFWVPGSVSFRFEYMGRSLADFWRLLTLAPSGFTSANLFGAGEYFTSAHIVLGLIAILYCFVKVPAARLLITTALFFFIVHLCYSNEDLRLLCPVVALSATAVCYFIIALHSEPWFARAGGYLLLVLCLVGYPSRVGFPPYQHIRSQLSALMNASYLGDRPNTYETVQHVRSQLLRHRDVKWVLTDLNPAYVSALLNSDLNVYVAPVAEGHDYRHSRQWFFNNTERNAVLIKEMSCGRPVLIAVSGKQSHYELTAPCPEGLHLSVLFTSDICTIMIAGAAR